MQSFDTFRARNFTALLFVSALASSPSFAASQDIAGVGNFHKVDDHVYRGAQPTDAGFRNLAKLGIKVVVDLREIGDGVKGEEKTVTAAGMRFVSIPMKGMSAPSKESVIKVLDLLEDATAGPVFVHCRRGADRTGNVIACYRIEHDRWQNEQALAEARSLGMSWFEKAIQHYVMSYQPRTFAPAPSALAGVAPALAAPGAEQ